MDLDHSSGRHAIQAHDRLGVAELKMAQATVAAIDHHTVSPRTLLGNSLHSYIGARQPLIRRERRRLEPTDLITPRAEC